MSHKVDIRITPARPSEAETLTAIAFAAKRHWSYPERWIAHWQESLTATPASIIANETFVARIGERSVGFASLKLDEDTLFLHDLWVLPGDMGHGVGRALFRHAQQRARARGFSAFELESDPNAASFYERMGAQRVGTQSTLLEGEPRELPVYRCSTT
ncbi:GNAT family N-acetyltransferase [Roseimicrobium sp. ORNL1]|uniref:GNAT family N-acetyltransferase n=1 Tax=Roseimicrobium sp. ORNL1 TaxID=2711231 RepID=UPI0013E15106|nr:GNAT family N-acetyltransferase [Roseimicrobium sp. ORNL1]QIF01658.1 GNAT family N-acetyltransferase [Roseimicrobium sp. ORNL1]